MQARRSWKKNPNPALKYLLLAHLYLVCVRCEGLVMGVAIKKKRANDDFFLPFFTTLLPHLCHTTDRLFLNLTFLES